MIYLEHYDIKNKTITYIPIEKKPLLQVIDEKIQKIVRAKL